MAAQFCLRSNDAYIATSNKDYNWTTVDDKFIIYDGTRVVSVVTYYYAEVGGVKTWYNEEGTVVPDPTVEYLTFTPSSGQVSVTPSSEWNATTKEYSTDGGSTWQTYSSGTVTGDTVMFRGLGGTKGSDGYEWSITPTVTGDTVECHGNIETILDYSVVASGEHPTMATACYLGMFLGCTSLTTAPELPATTLAGGCYSSMFYDCISLYVSDTSGTGYNKAWRIPKTGTFTTTNSQEYIFTNCAGIRSSDDMAGQSGQSYTYYTQNTLV